MRCGFEPGKRIPACGMDGDVVFRPGVPGLPPGASWGRTYANDTRSPRRKPGDSGSYAFPDAMRCGLEPGKRIPACGMDGDVVFRN